MTRKPPTNSSAPQADLERSELLERFFTNTLDQALSTHGYRDGRLLLTDTAATYTFLEEDEVIVLHFDRDKGSLFFKGHRLTRDQATPQIAAHFARFREFLQRRNASSAYLSDFDFNLQRLGLGEEARVSP